MTLGGMGWGGMRAQSATMMLAAAVERPVSYSFRRRPVSAMNLRLFSFSPAHDAYATMSCACKLLQLPAAGPA